MLWVLVWAIVALAIGVAAERRGRFGVGWFLLALLLSPLIAGVLLLLVGEGGIGRKHCPACAERVLAEAVRCKHCGADIGAMEVSAPRPRRSIGRGIAYALGWTADRGA